MCLLSLLRSIKYDNILFVISIIQRGKYRLIETKTQTKILILDNKDSFAWINAGDIGEILITSHKTHQPGSVLSSGNYRLYQVQNERNITDELHLELYVGDSIWQGYLLPTGLPTDIKKRNRIIPTIELITVQRTNGYQEEGRFCL